MTMRFDYDYFHQVMEGRRRERQTLRYRLARRLIHWKVCLRVRWYRMTER